MTMIMVSSGDGGDDGSDDDHGGTVVFTVRSKCDQTVITQGNRYLEHHCRSDENAC